MRTRCWRILPMMMTTIVMMWSCSGEIRRDANVSKADSLLFAAGNAKDYLKVLAIIDSLEDTGEI